MALTTAPRADQWSWCWWVVMIVAQWAVAEDGQQGLGLGGGVDQCGLAGLGTAQEVRVVVHRPDRGLGDHQSRQLSRLRRSRLYVAAVAHRQAPISGSDPSVCSPMPSAAAEQPAEQSRGRTGDLRAAARDVPTPLVLVADQRERRHRLA